MALRPHQYSDELPPRRGPRAAAPCLHRQHGAFAVMFVPLLIVIIGFCGLAIDMGQIYNRKVDLHGISKAVALAAARELNGTPEGIAAAKTAAKEAAENLRYRNFIAGTSFAWSGDALSFGTSPARSGTWVAATAVGNSAAQAAPLFFARVDTSALESELGTVETYFIKVLSAELANVQISDSAIAGKSSVDVVPIAICAMSTARAEARTAVTPGGSTLSELVQHGFRRGVSYDLMNLNPGGLEPLRFLVNPVAAAGVNSSAMDAAAVVPFVCSGSMWTNRVHDGTVRVSELPSSAPLAALRAALNTRFDVYTGTPCAPRGAAPDINVKGFAYDVMNTVRWMTPARGSAAAATTKARDKLETVADLAVAPSTPGDYGPLWAYSRAVVAPDPLNSPEPAGGYTTFAHTDWPTLYKSGPTASSYPAAPAVPYQSTLVSSGLFTPPRVANRPMAIPGRRVLHIPLLQCSPSAPSGQNAAASVLAIGRFFMTVQATDNSLIAEFAGLLSPSRVSGHVELFP